MFDRERPPPGGEGLVRYQRKPKPIFAPLPRRAEESARKAPSRALARVERPEPIQIYEEPVERPDQHPVATYMARLSPGSRPSMLSSIRLIASELGSTPEKLAWHELRYQHVQAIRARFASRYQPNSANRHLAALRGVLKEAKRLKLISAQDYAETVDFDPVRGERIEKGRALSEQEIGDLFAAIDPSTVSGARDAALVALLYGTGLRRNEATRLRVCDIDLDDRSLIVKGKGNKERMVYFDQGVAAAVRNWFEVRGEVVPDDPLLLPVDAWGRAYLRHMSDQAIRRRLLYLAGQCGVKEFAPHDLRRTFITRLLEKGIDLRTAQRLAGHAQVTTTQKYDRRGEEAKRKAVDVLAVPFAKR